MNGRLMADALPVALPGHPADRVAALFDAHHDRLCTAWHGGLLPTPTTRQPGPGDISEGSPPPGIRPARFEDRRAGGSSRVFINIRRDQWRKAAVRKRHDSEVSHVANVDNSQEAAMVARATVWRALDTLTPRRRAVVVMYRLEGLTMAAIASLLGISAITVRWHLSMGRRDLSRALTPRMGDSDEHR